MRMRHGAPGVLCSALMNPSDPPVEVTLLTLRIFSASVMAATTTSSSWGPTSGWAGGR